MHGHPDRLEIVIRFVGGFLLAWFVAGRLVGGGGLVAGVVTGLLSAWYGDTLWHTLARFLPWRR